jgi:hypothetical protein
MDELVSNKMLPGSVGFVVGILAAAGLYSIFGEPEIISDTADSKDPPPPKS